MGKNRFLAFKKKEFQSAAMGGKVKSTLAFPPYWPISPTGGKGVGKEGGKNTQW
jgi:hypothetical protein